MTSAATSVPEGSESANNEDGTDRDNGNVSLFQQTQNLSNVNLPLRDIRREPREREKKFEDQTIK